MNKILYILLFLSFCSIGQKVKIINPKVAAIHSFSYQGSKTAVCEKVGKNTVQIQSQYDETKKEVSFILLPSNKKKRILFMCQSNEKNRLGNINIFKDQEDISLSLENRPILSYKNGIEKVPAGVSELYAKSGFVHPIFSPNGTRLSRIQPVDHYHHYGIWGPWTKTTINGEHIDFWNLNGGTGTVLFDSFKNYQSGPAFSSFTATQHHLNLKASENEKLALEEDLEVKAWNIKDQYLIDYTSTFHSPLANGILFDAYRYGGGIGFRATEKWGTANSSVLTSEGKTRLDADGTNAKWCIIKGESEKAGVESGILFMSHPANQAHPEPMRVWPADQYEGKGNVFFEFCPIRHEEWKIEPNKTYQLKYRMLVFDGELSPQKAEEHWQAFANQHKLKLN